MSAERNLTDLDYELLSAYLDDALTAAERSALETRLQTEAALRTELDALRQTVTLVRGLPPLTAPRNFTLTPAMLRANRPRWLVFPTTATFSDPVVYRWGCAAVQSGQPHRRTAAGCADRYGGHATRAAHIGRRVFHPNREGS
jgi:anti-sigma factor RsiW